MELGTKIAVSSFSKPPNLQGPNRVSAWRSVPTCLSFLALEKKARKWLMSSSNTFKGRMYYSQQKRENNSTSSTSAPVYGLLSVYTFLKAQDYRHHPWSQKLNLVNNLQNEPKIASSVNNRWLWKMQNEHTRRPYLSMRLFIKTSTLNYLCFSQVLLNVRIKFHVSKIFPATTRIFTGNKTWCFIHAKYATETFVAQFFFLQSWCHCQTWASHRYPTPKILEINLNLEISRVLCPSAMLF